MINLSFSKNGRNWNEDRCYACDDFIYVLDGATSLFKQQFSSMSTDAEWYSNWWDEYLKVALHNYSLSVPEIIEKGIDLVVEDFKKLAGDTPILDFPSSTISIVRRNAGKLEIYALGDSPIVLQSKTDISILIAETLNNITDDINKIIIRQISKDKNLSIIEARQLSDCIKQGRNKKNQFGGYYILADDKNAISHGVYRFIDEDLISKVIIVSDGFSQIFDIFEKYTLNEFANKVNSLEDVQNLYQELYEMQDKDPGGDEFIRFKIRDDASLTAFIFDK